VRRRHAGASFRPGTYYGSADRDKRAQEGTRSDAIAPAMQYRVEDFGDATLET